MWSRAALDCTVSRAIVAIGSLTSGLLVRLSHRDESSRDWGSPVKAIFDRATDLQTHRPFGVDYGSGVDLWRCDGSYVGFRECDGLWSANGRYLGKFVGSDVFAPSGAYLGEILLPDRLACDPRKGDRQTSPSRKGSRAPRRRHPKYGRSMPAELSDFP